jgi:hypothetical protein
MYLKTCLGILRMFKQNPETVGPEEWFAIVDKLNNDLIVMDFVNERFLRVQDITSLTVANYPSGFSLETTAVIPQCTMYRVLACETRPRMLMHTSLGAWSIVVQEKDMHSVPCPRFSRWVTTPKPTHDFGLLHDALKH